MILARAFFVFGAAALAAAIVWAMGADARGLVAVLSAMVAEPWTVVTLIDLYLGFFLIAAVILMTEKNRLVGFFFALPVFVLGNVWAALWLVLRLPSLAARLSARD